MKLDTAIQNMLYNSTDRDLEDLAWLASNERDSTMLDYQANYGWTLEECDEFLENAALAHELLVKEEAYYEM